MKSFFVAGTDTDVGKTWIAAGLARAIRNMGVDIGVMKPFAAGTAQKSGYKSEDAQILANAAKVNDPENLVNPQFFPNPAAPYTAMKISNILEKVNVDYAGDKFCQSGNRRWAGEAKWSYLNRFAESTSLVRAR